MPGAQEGWGFCLPLGIYFSSCTDSSIAEVLKQRQARRQGGFSSPVLPTVQGRRGQTQTLGPHGLSFSSVHFKNLKACVTTAPDPVGAFRCPVSHRKSPDKQLGQR